MLPLLTSVIYIILAATPSWGIYKNSPYVQTIDPVQLHELQSDESDNILMVQIYNKSDLTSDPRKIETAGMVVRDYQQAAKTMKGFVTSYAVNILDNPVLYYKYNIIEYPTTIFYSYYKHLPITFSSLTIPEDYYQEANKQIATMFEEKAARRYIQNKLCYEFGFKNFNIKPADPSAIPWGIVFYNKTCSKCHLFKKTWDKIVTQFSKVIRFGAVDLDLTINEDNVDYNLDHPYIKFAWKSDPKSVKTYKGSMTYKYVYEFFLNEIITPKVKHLNGNHVIESCVRKEFCIFVVLPQPPMCNDKCRLEVLTILNNHAKRTKDQSWIWFWNVHGEQRGIEKVFDITMPAIVAFHVPTGRYRKEVKVDEDEIRKIIDNIIKREGFNDSVKQSALPEIRELPKQLLKDEL